MSGGGKGGKQTSEVKIPAWLEQAAQANIAKANEIAKIGYVPYFGPEVAAFTPTQQAAFANTGAAANAFGMAAPSDPMAGMPAPQTFAGGVQGYSSAPMFQQSLAALQQANPAQYAALMAPFLNPQTGAQPTAPFAAARPAPPSGGKGGRLPFGGNSSGSDAYGGGRDMHMGGPTAGGGSGTGSLGLPDPFGGNGSFTGFDPGGLPGIGGVFR